MKSQPGYSPVQSSRLYEEVAAQIRQRIVNADLRPGDRLPSETELVQEFEVSRTVVREAIHYLQAQGLVTVRHGSGVYVSEPSIGAFVEAFSTLLQLAETSVLSVQEVREILEVEIAGLAAERAGIDDLDALASVLTKMDKLHDSPAEYMESDLAFHTLLAEATHNRVLCLLVQLVTDLLRQSRIRSIMSPNRIEKSSAGHKQIFKYVKAGDRQGSRNAMQLHLAEVRQDLAPAEMVGDRLLSVEPTGRN
jgi:GntR family transcriptional repressor for pyruvate dehydrogenase complex